MNIITVADANKQIMRALNVLKVLCPNTISFEARDSSLVLWSEESDIFSTIERLLIVLAVLGHMLT